MSHLVIGRAALFLLASSAFAQLSLYTVQGNVETPVGQSSDFGSVANGNSETIVFRLMYTGSAAAYTLNNFSLTGTGFSVTAKDWQTLPAPFSASGYLDFTVDFQPNNFSNNTEGYSATLQASGPSGADSITVYLTGKGTPGLTLLLNNLPVTTGQAISFGNVQVGSTGTVVLMLANQTAVGLYVPAIQPIASAIFSVSGPALSGPAVPPGSAVELDVLFTPSATGPQQSTLTIGVLSFTLQGTGTAAPPLLLPKPSVQVNLPAVASAQQGSIAVNLSPVATSSISGTVTLAFQSAVAGVSDDPAITFSDGTRSASFTVAPGASTGQFATGPSLSFDTGTTAGTLVFTVTLGSNTAQANVVIPAAMIGIDAAVASRDVTCTPAELYCTPTNVELQISAWDNTRTASEMVFNFYDSSGNLIGPGNIPVDSTSAFQQYFSTSELGGVFAANVLFPVTGDPNQVAAAEVQLTNSQGIAQTARINF